MNQPRYSMPKWVWGLLVVAPLLFGARAELRAAAAAQPTAPWAAEDLRLPTATFTPSPTTTPTATFTATPTATQTPTTTVTATPKPYAEFDTHFPVRTGSKLSLHFVRGSPASYTFLQEARPGFVKLVDAALTWSPDLRREFPAMLQIGRITDEDHSLEQMDPVRAAKLYIATLLPLYQKYPDIDYWEGWNEWNPKTRGDAAAWQWYTHFEGARACLMQQQGYKAIIGNFATGRPEFKEMLLFVPAIRIGLKCGAILGLHEYSAPTMQYGYGSGIPNRPNYPDRGMLTFRYRFWYEDLLKPLDLPIPLAITEFGIDGGIDAGRPGPRAAGGWLDYVQSGYWKDIGLDANANQAYIAQLAWYDSEMRKDPYVIGAAIYTAGAYGYDSFEVDTLLPELTNYMRSLQGQ